MNTIDMLREAKAVLSDPDRWCNKNWGRKNGEVCLDVNEADSLCMVNALILVANGENTTPAHHALMRACPGGSAMSFNDMPTTTHADVIAAFDRAILSLATDRPANASHERTPGEPQIENRDRTNADGPVTSSHERVGTLA